MKSSLTIAVCFSLCLFALAPSAQAQYFKFDNNTYQSNGEVEDAVEGILKFFGAVVGDGMYHTADLHSVAGVDVGLRGVVANVPDEFDNLPVFQDESRVGLAFLHGSVGLPGNFELLGRFFYFPMGADADLNLDPQRAADSRGGITLLGGGLKYGLLQAPGLPKVMLLGAYHALMVPDEFDFGTVSTFSLKAVASYSVAIATIYAGAGIDFTKLKLNEDIPFPGLGGESFDGTETQFTVGATVTPFPLVRVNGGLSFGDFSSFNLGVGLSLR